MDVAIRVWERYRLAQRVAERAKTGDSMGDPRDLLAKYKHLLARYAEKEHEAKRYLELTAEIEKYKEVSTFDAEKLKQLQIERDGGGPGTGPFREKGSDIGTHLIVYGFKPLQQVAQPLCLAILQQLALPQKTRKSIEVAAKFWARSPRLNPRGRTWEESIVKRVELYMEHLELFRKHEKLFELALKEGKPHSETGDLVTLLKAGPFSVINTGGFDPKTMEDKARLCAEAAEKMTAIGLGKVCYGNVLITNRLSGERVEAFYMPANDEMFVRADAKVTLDTVRVVCHELTHRLEFKFLQGKKSDIVRLYAKFNTHAMINNSYTDFPKIGEPVEYEGKTMRVIDTDYRRRSVKIQDPDVKKRCFVCGQPVEGHQPDAEHKSPIVRNEAYSMPLQTFNRLKGIPNKVDPLDFITAYAKRGGPSENFAEMVSFYAVGQLPKEQVELLLPLLS